MRSAAITRRVVSALAPIVTVAIGVAVWWALVASGIVSPIIVPSPAQTARALYEMLGTAALWSSVSVTLQETVIGFVVGVAAGVVIGAMSIMIRPFREFILPYVVLFQNMPRVALAPVFLIWFGFGLTSKVVMAAAICFYPATISIMVGLTTASPDVTLLLRSYGARPHQFFWLLRLPTAAPLLVAAIKNSMALALVGAVVAEFVSAPKGLGILIQQSANAIQTDRSFAALFVLGLLGAALYGVLALLGQRALYWIPK